MKKRLYPILVLVLALLGMVLAGCRGPESTANNQTSTNDRQFTISLSMQLAVGTLKLEGTEAAVTPEQAAELLPLWKAARSLGSADNVTAQEREAIFNQIQKVMTDEQMHDIQTLDLSGQNMAEMMQELGFAPPAGGPSSRSDEEQSAIKSALEGGQQPGGGPPAGGGPPPGGAGEGMPPDGGRDGSAGNNDQADGGARGGFETAFYQAVIDLLEEKVK